VWCAAAQHAAPPIPNGKAVWKPQWDELKDFSDNEVIVSAARLGGARMRMQHDAQPLAAAAFSP
jgi:hypothetical protein